MAEWCPERSEIAQIFTLIIIIKPSIGCFKLGWPVERSMKISIWAFWGELHPNMDGNGMDALTSQRSVAPCKVLDLKEESTLSSNILLTKGTLQHVL